MVGHLTHVKSSRTIDFMGSTSTRERILECAWQLALERGVESVTLADVGRAAGISRQAVYLHFPNRATLLTHAARQFDRASGFDDRLAATIGLPPREAFETLAAEWLAYIPSVATVGRALEAAWMRGEDGGEAWRDRMDDLYRAMRAAIRRLDGAGLLRDGWDVPRAADWAFTLMQIENWYQLTAVRGWTHESAAEQILSTVRDTLIVPHDGTLQSASSRPASRMSPSS
jgi:AcrR family transcriptional regulator